MVDVQKPQQLLAPLVVPSKTLMGPGPSNCTQRVLNAMSLPVLGHMHSESFKIMDDIKEGIKYVFQTNNRLTLAVSASGHGGMEAVMVNLLEPGDKALIAVNGLWGKRAAEMARRVGAIDIIVSEEIGKSFTLAKLESAVMTHRPKVLFITQGESSSGVLQPLEGLGDICHRHSCLLAVDTVASLGGVEFYADRWGVDVVYTGSQKVLGAPPGLAPISFSPRAEKVILSRKFSPSSFYLDITQIGDYWNVWGRPRFYHHTGSTNLMYALREGLSQIVEEGLENTINRHKMCAARLHEGLTRLGFQFFVEDPFSRLPTVTTLKIPTDADWRKIIEYAMTNYKLELAGGLGDTVGKVIRIGIMGTNATPEKVDFVLKVLQEAMQHARNNYSSKL